MAHLTQRQIREYSGYKRAHAQERKLRELGYIVLGRNGKGELQVLDTHPHESRREPLGSRVVLDTD